MGKITALIVSILVVLPFFMVVQAQTREDMASTIVDHNIFSPERKYEPSTETSEEPSPEEKEVLRNIKLIGTVLYRTKRKAFLRISFSYRSKFSIENTDRRGCLWVEEGEKLGPFEVEKIGDGFVVLKKGKATSYRIELGEKKEARPPGSKGKRPGRIGPVPRRRR